MPDAIDNLVQDINQNNTPVDEFPGYPGYQLGQEVPGMAGVRVGDLFYGLDPYGQEAPYNWRTGGFEFQAAPQDLSNPSTFKTGEGIDFNVRDQPVERINDGNTDEKDAFVRTGIGTTLDPRTEDTYGVKGLVSPGDLGGTIGVVDVNPDDFAGQIPSVPQGVVTRGETVKIPGRGLPNYEVIGKMDDGSVIYLDTQTRKTFLVPGVKDYPGVADFENKSSGVLTGDPDLGVPSTLTKGTTTSVDLGGFENTGGKITAGPGGVTAGPGGTTNVTPGYKPDPDPVEPVSPWTIFDPKAPTKKPIVTPGGLTTGTIIPGTGGTKVGDDVVNDLGQKYDWETDTWSPIPPGTGTGTTPPVTTTPPGGGTTTTPPGGGTTTTPPGGGVRPGTGTGTGTYTGTPLPPRSPVTPLVRREVVIPTKGTKEVPLPDRQADPFAKLYADLLANAQQQKDQYRYINYDPEQIMNAAMSGFRRRGAMRSLQGY